MNKMIAGLAIALLYTSTASAGAHSTLFSEPEEGLFIVRHEGLSEALRESDRLCADYSKRQDEADRISRVAAAAPLKRSLQRERFSMVAAARRAMGECLNADKLAKKTLTDLFGPKTVDRLQKAAPFEDMVYVQLLPDSPTHFEALR